MDLIVDSYVDSSQTRGLGTGEHLPSRPLDHSELSVQSQSSAAEFPHHRAETSTALYRINKNGRNDACVEPRLQQVAKDKIHGAAEGARSCDRRRIHNVN
jgi:hypothetical protein